MKKDWQYAIDNDLEILHDTDLFDEFLDEAYGTVKIAGFEYATSRALKEIDPTAYRCGTADYIDSIVREGAITQFEDGTLVREDHE